MASRSVLRASSQALRSVAVAPIRTSTPACTTAAAATRSLHASRKLSDNSNKNNKQNSLSAGSFARTDENITVEYPEEGELPTSKPVTGRGGHHMKRTLASFSLEGKTGVVTGGARGLGLVMGQGMVISGANLAIVDMNSKSFPSTSPTSCPHSILPTVRSHGEIGYQLSGGRLLSEKCKFALKAMGSRFAPYCYHSAGSVFGQLFGDVADHWDFLDFRGRG